MYNPALLVEKPFCLLQSSPKAHSSLAPILLSISPQRSRQNGVLPSLSDALKKFTNHVVYPFDLRKSPFDIMKRESCSSCSSDGKESFIQRKLSIQDLLCDLEETRETNVRKSVNPRRQCRADGCYKYALAGGYCIRHGGGRRCKHMECKTVAQSGGLCKAHGGGSRCRVLGCDNVARRQGFCMLHGGRIECKFPGCLKCAHRGGYCIAHGGGKRCSVANCLRSVQTKGLCYSHGGGKRCKVPYCQQAARKGGSCMRHRAHLMI